MAGLKIVWYIAGGPYSSTIPCRGRRGRVPKTIGTRCVRYDLKPLPAKVLGELYDAVCEAEGGELPRDIADLLIRRAEGSPRQMLANFALCRRAADKAEAEELLSAAGEETVAFDLAKALYRGAGWSELQGIMAEMKEANGENVRHVVRSYGTKLVLGATREEIAGRACEILAAFSEPFHSSDGITPVLLACAKLKLAG